MRVLGIAGSLRAGSYNRGLLRAAQQLTPEGMQLDLWDLATIPLYNGDLEGPNEPEPVVHFKEAIRAADALLIATPEYNRGPSGVLKNAIDWASRPPLGSPLSNKLVAVMGASTGQGGTAKAQAQLRDALGFPRARVLPDITVHITDAYAKFDGNGNLTDEATRHMIRDLLEKLRDEAAK